MEKNFLNKRYLEPNRGLCRVAAFYFNTRQKMIVDSIKMQAMFLENSEKEEETSRSRNGKVFMKLLAFESVFKIKLVGIWN